MTDPRNRLDPHQEEMLWRQYELLTGTVEHGLELMLKLNIFYFAVTGAMLSFYVSRPDPTKPTLRLSLLLPLIMGLCFLVVAALHARTVPKAKREIERLAGVLGCGAWLDANTLRTWLWVSVVLHAVFAAGLGMLIFWPTTIARLGY